MGFFDFFKSNPQKKQEGSKSYKEIESKIEIQREGYLELANLGLDPKRNDEFKKFIKNLNDYNGDDEYMTTLNFVIDYLYQNSYSFILCLDWKQEIKNLSLKVSDSLLKNFGTNLIVPKQEDYDKRASVSHDNVFIDFDTALKNHGYQLSFIDTNSDEYMVLVHKVPDLEKVKIAIGKIGYECLSANSRKISG